MASQPSGGHEYSTNNLSDPVTTPSKRVRTDDDVAIPPAKKIKAPSEEPALYSENVRKKLAATSRTGQACDRCKERKMKCDPDPVACQPCRQKNLRCYTTDRVTGNSRERGQTDRAETEAATLREQLNAYRNKYGPLNPTDNSYTTHSIATSPLIERKQSRTAPVGDSVTQSSTSNGIPSSQYVGWPAPGHSEPLHRGPVDGTKVDILQGERIDIADFDCEMMHEYPIDQLNHFNVSKNSVTNTTTLQQNVDNPGLPPREQAMNDVQSFLQMMNQFMPIVHKPSFLEMARRLYDQPSSVRMSDRVQVIIVLAIMSQQYALRNHSQFAEKIEQSHRYFHYALSYYQDLYREESLQSMQAMTLILMHFRNLPKPGYTWVYGQNLLIRAIDMEYHRDPDKIELPPEDRNPLSKELRKRIFHSILSVCVTTGCRVGRPAPWQFSHLDVPLPMAIKDSEISIHGITSPLSGQCDFWPALQLAKLLPLLTELYNYIISVRRPESEYVKIVDALRIKIEAWRTDWDNTIAVEKPNNPFLTISGLLMDTWAAEYLLNLHHPSVCTAKSPEVFEKNLDVCHKAAKRLLGNFHVLSARYKSVDFTWHSTVAYALGFGATLHVYRTRLALVSQDQFESMRNELNGWLSLMAYADLVLRTGNHLQRIFQPLTQELEEEYRAVIARNSSHRHGSFSHVNGSSSWTPIKTEPNPQEKTYSVTPTAPTSAGIQTPQQPMHQTQEYSPSSVHLPNTSMASMNFPTPAYGTSMPQYQTMPNSLAPLLNEAPSNHFMNAYQQYTSSEVPMLFSPTHYMDNAASMLWPSMSTAHFPET